MTYMKNNILLVISLFISQLIFAKGDVAATLSDMKSRPLIFVKYDVNSEEFPNLISRTKQGEFEEKMVIYKRLESSLDSALHKHWKFSNEIKSMEEADFAKMNAVEKTKWTVVKLMPFNIGGGVSYTRIPGFLSLALVFDRAENLAEKSKLGFKTPDYHYPLPFGSDFSKGLTDNEMACFVKMVQLGIDENIKADKNMSYLQFAEAQTKANCGQLEDATIYMCENFKHDKADDEKYNVIDKLKIVSATDFDVKVGKSSENEYIFMGFQIDGTEAFLITGQYVINPNTGQILNCFRENGLGLWPGRVEKSFKCP